MFSFAATPAAADPATLTAISALLAALGLSSTAGIRAYLPLFAVGLASHTNVLHLQSQFKALGDAGPLVILGALMVGEFVVDKIPILDHVSDFVHTFIRPLSGAAIMAGTQNSLSDKSGLAAALLGGGLALVFHGVKSATRPAVSATTAGMGNPVVSLLEDVGVVFLVLVLIFAPIIGFAIFVGLVLLIWRLLRRILRFFRRGRRAPGSATAGNAARVVDASSPPAGRGGRKSKAAAAAGGAAVGVGAAAMGRAKTPGQGQQPPVNAPTPPMQTPTPNTPGGFAAAPTQTAPTVPAPPPFGQGAGAPNLPPPHTMRPLPQTQTFPGQGGQPAQPAQPGQVYPPDAPTLPGNTP